MGIGTAFAHWVATQALDLATAWSEGHMTINVHNEGNPAVFACGVYLGAIAGVAGRAAWRGARARLGWRQDTYRFLGGK